MKRFLSVFLCIILITGLFPSSARAADWPDNVSIQAEGGIVVDADTGTILYGKNIHTPYYPASITKILTALIVIERCDLDEMVTFSHNAVYNVEKGSTSAGLDEGDVLSVRDCLYALILKSANEAANALAEHVAGSVEEFAQLMNVKAASLGCQDSHFANPSGLNDPNHYTSAYDMSLIGRAALDNEIFMEIDSTLIYKLPPTKRNKEGLTIYPGHKMIKKNMPEYYSGALGGKTGYTSLAGNTLVTFASQNGMRLVAVVLNGHVTHYSDTKAMLNFGFRNFLTVPAADFDTDFTSVENDMTIGGLSPTGLSGLELDSSMKITIPKDAGFSSVTSQLSYDLTTKDPPGSIARVQYFWGDNPIGYTYLTVKDMSPDQIMLPAQVPSLAASSAASSQNQADTGETAEDGSEIDSPEENENSTINSRALTAEENQAASDHEESGQSVNSESPAGTADSTDGGKASSDSLPWFLRIPIWVWLLAGGIICVALLTVAAVTFRNYSKRKEEEARLIRRKRRLERLEQSGISSEEFDHMVQRHRSQIARKRSLISGRQDDNLL